MQVYLRHQAESLSIAALAIRAARQFKKKRRQAGRTPKRLCREGQKHLRN